MVLAEPSAVIQTVRAAKVGADDDDHGNGRRKEDFADNFGVVHKEAVCASPYVAFVWNHNSPSFSRPRFLDASLSRNLVW